MKCLFMIVCVLSVIVLSSAQFKPNCNSGRSGEVLVHLFEWRWDDIAEECENVLGPRGFCGVQVSPPNEHRIVTSPDRPWWERYQPVSYKLESDSGNRTQFINMVEKCNSVGVRVYVDAVINHMAGIDAGTGLGTGGSYYNTQNMTFDGVPYGPNDFGKSCNTSNGDIQDFDDVYQVRDCRLLGLLDLAGGSYYVRQNVSGYLNDMLDIGIDGIRIDAAKHMWQKDIEAILALTQNSTYGKPYVYQQVIDPYGSTPIKSGDYDHIGQVTEFKYGIKMGEIFKTGKTKLTYLQNFGSSWGMLDSGKALVFVDNHDNQRGHEGEGAIITHKDPQAYKMAAVFMLSWPYGTPRVMSSYAFHEDWTGPPSADPGNGTICQNGWVCEHRWRQIMNMVAWRNSAGTSPVTNWWSNGNNQIAFSRGGKSFIAFNKQDGQMNVNVQTSLPAGQYCDIISGNPDNTGCSGETITVGSDGKANIQIDGSSEDPMIAIHAGSKVSSDSGPGTPVTTPPITPPAPIAGPNRTVIFIKKHTKAGEDLFLRGGCHISKCTIPITYQDKTGSHFTGYNTWNNGDIELDWAGPEASQDRYNSQTAEGSPMVWTTNQNGSSAYSSINKYGDHYWMWDVMMDCSNMTEGWFEVKGYMDGHWEADVNQQNCTGVDGIIKNVTSFNTNNHVARCGFVNVFEWSSSLCKVDPFETESVLQKTNNSDKDLQAPKASTSPSGGANELQVNLNKHHQPTTENNYK